MNTTDDGLLEAVARAISNCEWDQACSALGTPNFPRGANWTAKLPQAQAAIAAWNTRTTPSLVTDDEVAKAAQFLCEYEHETRIAASKCPDMVRAGAMAQRAAAMAKTSAALAASDRDVLVGRIAELEQLLGR